MKLSEAIRLGAMMGPQKFGDSNPGPNGERCANMGALLAAGGFSIWESWPWLRMRSHCPVCGDADMAGSVIAMCLNDRHRWTREQIADWVATIEPQESGYSASETNGECSLGTGPIGPPPEVETAETKTILI